MDFQSELAVTERDALQFFFEQLRDLTQGDYPNDNEVLYNASVLAHYAVTSTFKHGFLSAPTSLVAFFDLFVMDKSEVTDPDVLEAGGSQCLLLTGFFCRQLRHRHNLKWYASLGAKMYWRAACSPLIQKPARAFMLGNMGEKFEYWRLVYAQLAKDLHDSPYLLKRES